MDDLLTVREVADLLRVTPMTVYRAIEAGTLKHLRFGRTIRIARSDLEEYTQAQTRVPRTRQTDKTRNRAPVTRL